MSRKKVVAPLREAPQMKAGMSSVVEEDAKAKRVAYKDMRTLYEAEQKRADRLSRGEAARELGNEENSDWVRGQLKKAMDTKERNVVQVRRRSLCA